MVTDDDYRALVERVNKLEAALNVISQKYTELYMKSGFRELRQLPEQQKHQKHKNTTKYVFNGRVFGKRALVLACVKYYVDENEISDSQTLIDVFPDYVQGSMGIIKKVEDAEKYSNPSKRFFFGDNEVIHLSDGVYTVCSQWDVKNIYKFISLAKDLGMEIETLERKY